MADFYKYKDYELQVMEFEKMRGNPIFDEKTKEITGFEEWEVILIDLGRSDGERMRIIQPQYDGEFYFGGRIPIIDDVNLLEVKLNENKEDDNG